MLIPRKMPGCAKIMQNNRLSLVVAGGQNGRKNDLLELLYLYSESYPMVQSPKCLTICPDVFLELLPVKNMPSAAI